MADPLPQRPPPSERVRDIDLIERALKRAIREALQRHKQAGNPISIWRDGRIVWLEPDEIPVTTEE